MMGMAGLALLVASLLTLFYVLGGGRLPWESTTVDDLGHKIIKGAGKGKGILQP